MTTKNLIKKAKNRNDIKLLYDFTKLFCETDSIGESWTIGGEYSKERFEKEITACEGGEEYNYLAMGGLQVYEIYLKKIKAIH